VTEIRVRPGLRAVFVDQAFFLVFGFWFDVWSLRVGLFYRSVFIYRFVLPSMAFFDASPWHYESLFEGRKN